MLAFVPSKDTETIAMEFNGKATQEDLEKFDKVTQEKFGEKGGFNVYLVVHDFDGASAKAMFEEVKIDVNRWSQYNKLAVVSDKSLLGAIAEFAGYLPGVQAKHFDMDEMEAAWEWIKN
ncbi:STAS/SEC14 domain-containing protein [Planococcus liqunii]|uniref:STAS/SEC14 domain-containing protein n=1 Tax=Planococcus liqunii TaxID=3058394 RepID=UPI002602DE70|nr:STAS/SEC14 domain-containing protein [Planococcus sp. N056]WKA51245.1 STAS/SEC14 domain-containing protein [Planococcus sp. N056]